MRRDALTAALLLAQLACAARTPVSMQLSRAPRGTDVTLLPVSIALLAQPGSVSLQLASQTHVTVFEQTEQGDSLRVAFATSADTLGVLDGAVTIRVDGTVRLVLAGGAQDSLVRESCVVVQRAAGDRGLPLCGAASDAGARRAQRPAASWRFARALVLLATEEPYRGATRIPIGWFSRIDGEPPTVTGGWGAIPFGAPLSAAPTTPVSR